MSARIAVVGDMHSSWDDEDVRHFAAADYDLLLFVGDLGGSAMRDGLRIARSMSRLGALALVMPGNNDVEHYPRFGAELTLQRGLIDLMNNPELEPRSHIRGAGGEVRIAGYSNHRVSVRGFEFTVIAARPFAMGGSELSFPAALREHFGVSTMAESSARLLALVDDVATEHVVFLAHNGPAGLGGDRGAIWGCDFRDGAGDFGDGDLRAAVDRALHRKLRVLAVVAGHMHRRLKGGGEREWKVERDGVLYVNAARVPRIFTVEGHPVHHHVALRLSPDGAEAEDRLVVLGGS